MRPKHWIVAQPSPEEGHKCCGNSPSNSESKGKADRIVVHAEDALIAALKVKAERPWVTIMYVRRLNRRGGDTRHPPHTLAGGS